MTFLKRFLPSGFVHQVLGLFLSLALIASATAAESETTSAPKSAVKLLTVGNSFAVNATTYLPMLAKEGGKTLVLLNCYKGGCSLEQHAGGLNAYIADPGSPKAKIYTHKAALASPDDKRMFGLHEALSTDKWDVVTIQQYSAISYKPETYEPYAKQVIALIRELAPQAEIRILQTWAYREDDPLFQKGDFTQQQMFDQLKAAYAKLAGDYQLNTIPIGAAFQAARATDRWHFVPDTTFDFANAKEGSLPNQTGSLNVGWKWGKDKKTLEKKLGLDAHHANAAGQYLGSAVLYENLFNDDVRKVNYCPNELKPEEAADLRRIAHETVQAQSQAAKAK